MSGGPIEIVDVPPSERDGLNSILQQSFEGLYLWHSRRTLRSISTVKAARVDGETVGLSMLKTVAERVGYIYYVAVAKQFRGRGVGGKLVDDALSFFVDRGMTEVYASVEEENTESNALFKSRGFEEITGKEFADKYGRVKSFIMSREMMVVRGEKLLRKRLQSEIPSPL